jgi:hypothetical protein
VTHGLAIQIHASRDLDTDKRSSRAKRRINSQRSLAHHAFFSRLGFLTGMVPDFTTSTSCDMNYPPWKGRVGKIQ